MAKTHVIDGVTYVEVDREAKVGDKVFVTNSDHRFYKKGDYATVTKVFNIDKYGVNADLSENDEFFGDGKWGIDYRDYVVLEPKPTPTLEELTAKITPENKHEEVFVDTTQASPEVIDLLTNLARRVTELEKETRLLRRENVILNEGRSMTLKNVDTLKDGLNAWIETVSSLQRNFNSLETQLRSTQRNLETTAEELANARHRIRKHEDRFAAVEDKVEMLTDDICELDERTQGLTVKHDFYFDKTSVMEFTIDMILHDLNGICEKLRKVGGGAK